MAYSHVRLNTVELAPTQASIGGFEVMLKADRFKLMSSTAISGYLREKESKGKPVLVVKGLRRYFVVDGHHTLSAILKASQPRELDIALHSDFSDAKTEDEFWQRMSQEGLLYERCLGVQVSPHDFPDKMLELVDDPFRSIAWLIRKMGAFEDLRQPYQEFRIADFLREHMAFSPLDFHEFETACVRAYELMRSHEAKRWADEHGLPGMKKTDGKKPDDLVSIYYDVLTAVRRPRHYRRR